MSLAEHLYSLKSYFSTPFEDNYFALNGKARKNKNIPYLFQPFN